MDGNRFDALTRSLGSGRSRRGILKGLGAAALGVAGLSRFGPAEAASSKSNTACARFCTSVYGGDTAASAACTTQAAHGTGLCYQCGPAAPANGLSVCGQTCVDESSNVNNCGGCGIACTGGDACNAPVCTPSGCSTTPTSGGSCTAASGAPGTCQSGTCVADICAGTTPGSSQCSSNSDCASGHICENGGCFQDCSVTYSCDSCIGDCFCAYSAGGSLVCADNDYYVGSCDVDSDCPQGSICDLNISDGGGRSLCTRPCPTYQPA